MKGYFLIIFFTISFSGSLFSQSKKSINQSEKKYIKHYFLGEKYKALDEYEKAKTEYQICIKENPRESAAFFELAKIHFNLDDYHQAKEYTLEAKKINPKNIWYSYLLIDIYHETLEFKKQAEVWEDLIKVDNTKTLYYLEAIYTYLNLELYDRALKVIKGAEKNLSENEDVIILKSEVFQKKNQTDRAVDIILEAHKNKPKNLLFLKKLSELYVLKSEYDLANNIYEKILKLEPENSTALLASYKISQTKNLKEKEKKLFLKIFLSSQVPKDQKIDILFEIFSDNKKTERYKDHIPQVLNQCIMMYPEEVMFYVVLADFKLLHNDKNGALKEYINAINYGFKDKILYEKILNINLVNNELDEVLFYSDQALEYFPFHPIFYYYKGLAFMYKKEYKKSIKILKEGLDYVIDEPILKSEIYAVLGDMYHNIGNNEKSDEFYDLALKINPDYIIVLNNYSYYLALRGGVENLLKAELMIIKCLELTKANPEPSFLDTYAWVLFQQGQEATDKNKKQEKYGLSKKIMDSCFEYGGNSAVMHEHYGDILLELNDINAAKKQWAEAFKKDPGNKNLEKKINNY